MPSTLAWAFASLLVCCNIKRQNKTKKQMLAKVKKGEPSYIVGGNIN
jgi:hypothetical protein